MSSTFAKLLDIYIQTFDGAWRQVIAGAPYAFRTDASVKPLHDALGGLKTYAQDADALVADIEAGRVDAKAASGKIRNLERLLDAHAKALPTVIEGVQSQDRRNLTNAATLDQPKLKGLADKLAAGPDADLSGEIAGFVDQIKGGLVGAVAGTGATESEADAKKAAEAVAKEYDLKDAKTDRQEMEMYNELSGAAAPTWLGMDTTQGDGDAGGKTS